MVLIEQFRIGALCAGREPWLIEVVAGIIEAGERAEAVARREALEEAGCGIGELVEIANVLVSPGGTSQTTAIYCGRTEAAGLGGIHGIESEDIRVGVVPFADGWGDGARGPHPGRHDPGRPPVASAQPGGAARPVGLSARACRC